MINKKFLIIKTIVFLIAIFIAHIVMNAFEPVISASVAVQQAYDTYDSSASIKIYTEFKRYSHLFWIAIGVLIYWKEIKHITTTNK